MNLSRDKALRLLQQLTQAALHTLEVGKEDILTSQDVLYLTQMVEMDLTTLTKTNSATADAAEVMVSIATNYVKMASLLLEPHTAAQWMGLKEDEVRDDLCYFFTPQRKLMIQDFWLSRQIL